MRLSTVAVATFVTHDEVEKRVKRSFRAASKRGWELVGIAGALFCFKRPRTAAAEA